MLFFVHLQDYPDHLNLRISVRPAHLEYMARNEDHILLGGPASSESMSSLNGTVLLVDFPDQNCVSEFLDDDLYAKSGLFEKRTVVAWHPTRVFVQALSNLGN